MKEKAEFRLNAVALAFVAYEARIKRIVKYQQARFVKGDYHEAATVLYGPDEHEITEATEMLWQAYLCGLEARTPQESYALAVPAATEKQMATKRRKRRV